MKDPICPLCHNSFLPSGSHQKYCDNCRESGAITRARDRNRDRGKNISKGYTRWVRVLKCPKDDPGDVAPPFTPGVGKFPFDQFVDGLKEDVWPIGMEVEVSYFRENEKDGMKQIRRRYTVMREQGRLARKLVKDREELTGGG